MFVAGILNYFPCRNFINLLDVSSNIIIKNNNDFIKFNPQVKSFIINTAIIWI